MEINPYYKVTQLKSFIGEKKLKQVGLLHCKSCPPLSQIKNNFSFTIAHDTLSNPPEESSSFLMMDVLNKYSPTTTLYDEASVNYLSVCATAHDTENADLLCPECGKLYHTLETNTYEALPIILSDVEADALKGIFVDLYL